MKKALVLASILICLSLIGGASPGTGEEKRSTKSPQTKKHHSSDKCIKNIQQQQTKLLDELKEIKQNIDKIKKTSP